MSIIIGADFVPTPSNYELFETGNLYQLFGDELLSILQEADKRIFNLEIPLTDERQPILKSGPNLIAPSSCINAYKELKVDILTLANNHILDQGVSGAENTCDLLKTSNIGFVGVGKDIQEAKKPYVFFVGNKKIGVYACAEHEYSIVTDKKFGANPIDLLDTPDDISELKKECGYVIVLYHGGKEHYPYPSPQLQKICRKLVDKGADLVICQHSHCIGCEEKYKSGTIVYGQGNFLFDGKKDECWKTGLLIKINNDESISYIPIKKQDNVIRIASDFEKKRILSDFYNRSAKMQDPEFIKREFIKFSKTQISSDLLYLRGIRTRSMFYKVLYKFFGVKALDWLIKLMCQPSYLTSVCNMTRCETHREVFITGIENMK